MVYQPLRRTPTEVTVLATPKRRAFNLMIAQHRDYFRVRVGHPAWLQMDGETEFDLDLCGLLSVRATIDVATAADLFVGQACFTTALAKALKKPFVCLLPSVRTPFVTPAKVLDRGGLGEVVYDTDARFA